MKLTRNLSAFVAAAAIFGGLAQDVQAKSNFPSLLPNGNRNSCQTCHNGATNGNSLNEFGISVFQTGGGVRDRVAPPNWSKLFSLDSDGDGYTNGVELGNADGTWTSGATAGPYLSHPGKADSTPCGNGQIDAKVNGSEECDGTNFGGKTCADFGGDAGAMPKCSSTCTIDASMCAAAPEDMGMSSDDMGADMAVVNDDMGSNPGQDMGTTPTEDMGGSPNQDMGTTNPTADMSAGADMKTETPATPTTQDEEDGCSAAGMGSPVGSGALMLFSALGLMLMRRRRR